MPSVPENPDDPLNWLEVVRSKVAGIRFGSVQIIVHEGRVTQVESVEKTRIDPALASPAPRSAESRKSS